MAKKMLIDATHPEETRVVVVDGQKVDDFDFESINKRQLAGNIYLAKVTRVEPSLQAAFVDYGGNRHGFLAFAEIHPDYYQIPVADREALIAEEAALARAAEESGNGENGGKARKSRRGGRSRKAEAEKPAETAEQAVEIAGFGVIDLEPAEAAGDDEVTDPAPEAVADDAGSSETASAEAEASVEGPALRPPRRPRRRPPHREQA
ncbi:MAG: ribonuclease E/G, partial [Pseudomonadota bacterium]